MFPAPGGRISGSHLSGSNRCAALLSRTKDHPRLPRHRQMCRFVRVAEGFRAENAVSEPRHGQDRQIVCVVAGGPWNLDIECVKHTIGAFCGRGARDLAGFMAMKCVKTAENAFCVRGAAAKQPKSGRGDRAAATVPRRPCRGDRSGWRPSVTGWRPSGASSGISGFRARRGGWRRG